MVQIDLGLTKGGQRKGRRESITTKDPQTVLLLAHVLQNKPPGTMLFPESSYVFRKCFADAVAHLGFPRNWYLPYALRRGGATEHFLMTGQLDATVVRGRWSNARTARIYINEGAVELENIRLQLLNLCLLLLLNPLQLLRFCIDTVLVFMHKC